MAGKLTARKVKPPSRASTATAATYIWSFRKRAPANGCCGSRGAAGPRKGLGSAASVPLADARERAATARRKIAQGLNPIHERKRTKPKAVWVTPPRRTAPTEAYEAERWLTELADRLGQQDYDLGAWFAKAVRRRNESGETLERALGLLHETAGTPSIKARPRSDAERRRRTKLALDAHPHVKAVPAGKKIP